MPGGKRRVIHSPTPWFPLLIVCIVSKKCYCRFQSCVTSHSENPMGGFRSTVNRFISNLIKAQTLTKISSMSQVYDDERLGYFRFNEVGPILSHLNKNFIQHCLLSLQIFVLDVSLFGQWPFDWKGEEIHHYFLGLHSGFKISFKKSNSFLSNNNSIKSVHSLMLIRGIQEGF